MKKTFIFSGLLMYLLHMSVQAANCAEVEGRLNELAGADQQIRQEWDTLWQDAKATQAERDALQRRWRAIDGANLKEFNEIVAACGWPKEAKGSHSAWLLAQHADSDPAFQRQARDLLEVSVKAGIGAPRDLAYLADRIASNEGRPQEYGTQFTQPDRCHLVLAPVDSRELVNRRRLAVGLPSLEAYEAEGRRRFIPADCSN